MAEKIDRTETSAGAVVFRRTPAGPRFLVILDGHGNWGFPKGHVERLESLEDAAYREVREETGIADATNHGTLGIREWSFDAGDGRVRKVCHFFLFEAARLDAAPQTDEGIKAVEWLDRAVAAERLTFPASRSMLAEAVDRLRLLQPADRAG